jgi:hypothetical protein
MHPLHGAQISGGATGAVEFASRAQSGRWKWCRATREARQTFCTLWIMFRPRCLYKQMNGFIGEQFY